MDHEADGPRRWHRAPWVMPRRQDPQMKIAGDRSWTAATVTLSRFNQTKLAACDSPSLAVWALM